MTEVAIAPALSAVSSSPESQKIVEQQREATTSHHKQSESQSQSKTVILCRDTSGRTCLRKQSKKKQRNIDICLIELYDFSFLLISNLCLLSPKMSTSLPTQDMNLPLTPALHRLDPEILFLEVGGQKEAGDVSEQPQTRQKRKIRVRTKIPLSSEVVR